jgi:CubicO group peptidase (beta-lactamase class C family)
VIVCRFPGYTVYHSSVRKSPFIMKLCCSIALLGALGSSRVFPEQASSRRADPEDARIGRIERGLLPAAIIRGQPLPVMTLADRMKYYSVPGLSIAFFEHGQVAWARGYGLADVAADKPVTPATLFQAASDSKSVTALAALRLVQERKLNLDEDVNVKLKSWKVPDNEFTKNEKVTLRRLLSHTAGVTVGGFAGYKAGDPLPTTVQILNGEKPANNEAVRVARTPGKEFRYSGGGYVVVQLLLMDVTGKSFPALMHDLVFQPLGMTHSTFGEPLPRRLWPNAALPYDAHGEPIQGGWHTYPEMAPAGLWTTPSDLARFANEIEKSYSGQSKLISSALAHQMLAYQSDEVYGLGVALGTRGHALRFWHSGANTGYRCVFESYAAIGEGLAITTNGDSGFRLTSEIQRAVAQEYDWPDGRVEEHALVQIDPADLRVYTGLYLFGGLFKFTITQQNGKLYVQYSEFGEEPQELFAESDTRFFMTSHPVVIDFQKESDGSIKKAKIRNGPEQLDGEKTSEAPIRQE